MGIETRRHLYATFFSTALLCLSCLNTASAQYVVSARAGMVHDTVGAVFLDEQPVEANVAQNLFPQMREGQSLRTEDGRAEVLLSPSIFLRMGESSSLRMDSISLADTQFSVERGVALVEVVELTKGARIQVRLGSSVTEFGRPGVYRFEASQGVVLIFGGEAVVRNDRKIVKAKRGSSVTIRQGATKSAFDTKATDALQRWSSERSFKLFDENAEARQRQTHWQLVGLGFVWNEDFGVKFYSAATLADFNRKQREEARQQEQMKRMEAEAQQRDAEQRQKEDLAAYQQQQQQQQQASRK
jgi:hypothetical protein